MIFIKDTKNAFFRQLFFIVVLILIALIIWNELGYMLSGVLGAITLYMLLRPVLFKLTKKYCWKFWQASALLTFLTVAGLLATIALVITMVISEIPSIDMSGLIAFFGEIIQKINGIIGKEIISNDIFLQYKGLIMQFLSGFINTTYTVVINLCIMLLLLYFMFLNAEKMEKTFVTYLPFKGESLGMIKRELKNMIFGNAVVIPLIMFIQAVLSALGYWIFGFQDVGFYGFITALAGLIPLIGTAGVWLPLGIYLITSGNVWQGIGLIIYGGVVVSGADSVCRFIFMKKTADVHPLITIFGVIMGVPLFGFWGIIFGPLLLSGFLLLMRIYHEEYVETENELI
ncbi:MAG: AI-2E family transporter [Candidatus Azobacteroides sp.]|nr:AI-2E family transporter [Candidatus Azobacteroides sp.]